eukprot:Tbor_TRINITY_DN4785_c0_g1::TRINITY_DN4785_c0_g1_i1::g.17101::m.17101
MYSLIPFNYRDTSINTRTKISTRPSDPAPICTFLHIMSVTATQHDKFFEEICIQNQNFLQYERNFQQVLIDLEADDILETFRQEYESIHHSFVKSHEGEKRLIKKCLDLKAEAISYARKIKAAEDLSVGDHNTIEQLKKETERTKEKIILSKEIKIGLRDKIKSLKGEIKELEKQVSRGSAGILPHDATINELSSVRRELHADLDKQKTHYLSLESEIESIETRVNKIKNDKVTQEQQLANIRDDNDKMKEDIEDWRVRKERKERELLKTKEELAKRNKQFKEGQSTIEVLLSDIGKLEEQVQQGNDTAEQGSRQLTVLLRQMQEVHQKLHDCSAQTEQHRSQITKLTHELKLKDSEVAGVHVDQVKCAKLVNGIEKRNIVVESQRADAEIFNETLKLKIKEREVAVSNLANLLDNDRKQLEDLSREHDVLNKTYVKAHNSNQKQHDWLLLKDNQKLDLNHQIRSYERHLQIQNQAIYQLTKEVEGYTKEANEAALKYGKAMDQNKTLDNLCKEEERRIQVCEEKIKLQKSMLEAVLKDRNLYSKNYNELRIEIGEMGRKFKIMINQIKQMKDEIQSKEKELVTEEAIVTAQTTLRKKHEIHIDVLKKKIEKREAKVEAYTTELHNLNKIIAEADVEKRHQQRDHTNVLNERDILGSQLHDRNNELAQLYEKIRIQQFQLRNGETLYNDRLRDIQQMELRISQLDEELIKMKEFASKLPELQLLINKTDRELTKEQCRVRGLLDECDNRQNVHRIHNLAWSEPQTYELHQKVHTLQKELLKKRNEVEAKNKLIQKKEKLFIELKGVISRQPGPEIAEQLNIYQDTLQKKVAQMRNIKLSLQHFEEKVDLYKNRYEDLNEELTSMGNDYYNSRKAQERERRKQLIMNEMRVQVNDEQPEETYVGYTAPPRPQTPEINEGNHNIISDEGVAGEAEITVVDNGINNDDNKEYLDGDNNNNNEHIDGDNKVMDHIQDAPSVEAPFTNVGADYNIEAPAEEEMVAPVISNNNIQADNDILAEIPHTSDALGAVGNTDFSEQSHTFEQTNAQQTDGEDHSSLNNDNQ